MDESATVTLKPEFFDGDTRDHASLRCLQGEKLTVLSVSDGGCSVPHMVRVLVPDGFSVSSAPKLQLGPYRDRRFLEVPRNLVTVR